MVYKHYSLLDTGLYNKWVQGFLLDIDLYVNILMLYLWLYPWYINDTLKKFKIQDSNVFILTSMYKYREIHCICQGDHFSSMG